MFNANTFLLQEVEGFYSFSSTDVPLTDLCFLFFFDCSVFNHISSLIVNTDSADFCEAFMQEIKSDLAVRRGLSITRSS